MGDLEAGETRMDEWHRVRPTVLHSSLDPTRARPEPWFVGNGRGLMIVILSLCAVLLVLRGLTIVWMAEAAWDWLQRARISNSPPASASASAPTLLQADLPAAPPAPKDVADRPVAVPKGNVGAAFQRESYPMEALRMAQEGRAVVRLAIDADGRPTGCSVLQSSQSTSLDRTTCAIGFAKIRFEPPRRADGRPVPGRYDLKVRWALEN